MLEHGIKLTSDFQAVSAWVIFLLSYLVFAVGKFPGMAIDRTGAAVIGAVLMFATGILTPDSAVNSIDFSTLVLLFSMMLVISYVHKASFFNWAACIAIGRLKPRFLLPTVIFTTGILSAFFINDIICIAMVPLVLRVTRSMKIHPLPYLLAVATAANIGSVATITGNPQNILIGSYSGIGYLRFMSHLGPVAIAGLFIDWFVIHLCCKRQLEYCGGIQVSALPDARHHNNLLKPGIVVILVLLGFLAGYPPALVASAGAAAMLISRARAPSDVYKGIDWGLLVFFVGLFLITGGAEEAGISSYLLGLAHHWNLHNPGIFTVVVALLSNAVSNVPAVMLVKSMVGGFPDAQTGWLLLAMASTLAGNLTITGSVANVIVVKQAENDYVITLWDYMRVGLPVTLLTLSVGLVWLVLIF